MGDTTIVLRDSIIKKDFGDVAIINTTNVKEASKIIGNLGGVWTLAFDTQKTSTGVYGLFEGILGICRKFYDDGEGIEKLTRLYGKGFVKGLKKYTKLYGRLM